MKREKKVPTVPSQSTGNTPTGFFDAEQHSLPSSDLNLPHTSGMETFIDDNVADLLTKGFDLARFNFLVVTIEYLEALLLRLRGGYALNREVRRLKKQNISQAKQIHKLKAKLKKLSKGVKPLVKHHILWVKSQKLKKRGKKKKKKVSSVKLGRNKDEGNLSEEHHDQDDHNHTTFVYEDQDEERKSDETEQMIIEEEKDTSDVKSGDTEELDLERIQNTSDVKSGDTEELDLERIQNTSDVKSRDTEELDLERIQNTSDVKSWDTEELDLEEIQSTARQSAITPRTLNFEDE
ncbi:hypothetical protein Tco_0082477, partial [Tanacetum coccineum]